ncbi:S9 family peptidase [Kordiimonas sp. SCSIO 12610]|uniref:alpha/beta hydrolase family protein n=1 Tax=Kordiimonas sp. SCSIO 12610 TaxID=2829597 RepID=UPI00210E28E3|nr:alpha/beta fold hydrolase [Kordiimonas sp. SCSIO 12610]UTW54668.1 alpha/beta fold hydrolase [Kordiimonas sp. SCSIO 12610]
MRQLAHVWASICLIIFAVRIEAADDNSSMPIPANLFAAPPSFHNVKISPSGKDIGYISSKNGKLRAYFSSVEGHKRQVSPIFPGANLKDFYWASDSRILLVYETAYIEHGENSATYFTRLYGINRSKSGRKKDLNIQSLVKNLKIKNIGPRYKRIKREALIQDQFVSFLPNDPNHILLSLDSDQDGRNEIRKINVHTAAYDIVRNDQRGIQNWHADENSNIRLATGYEINLHTKESNSYRALLKNNNGEWSNISESEWFKKFEFQGFVSGENAGYFSTLSDWGTVALYKLNLDSGGIIEDVYVSRSWDVDEVLLDPIFRNPIGVSYRDPILKSYYFDSKYKSVQLSIDGLLPNRNNRIVDKALDADIYIIRSSSQNDSDKYFVFDNKQTQLSELTIKAGQANRKAPVAITIPSKTGSIVAKLYRPLAQRQQFKSPIVLLSGDARFFNELNDSIEFVGHYLASLGYFVVQPQYSHTNSEHNLTANRGFRAWNQKANTHILDIVEWAKNEPIVDGDNVCVIGYSLGGYTAFMTASRKPTPFKCVVSINSVPNGLSIELDEQYARIGVQLEHNFGLNKNMGVNSLHNLSTDFLLPSLMIAAENDHMVSYKNTRAFHRRLIKQGKDSKYVQIENGGHYLATMKSRLTILNELENFLAKHIGEAKHKVEKVD